MGSALISRIYDLGENIALYEGNDPDIIASLSKRYRFLDVLWLPVPLGEMKPAQIVIINRFREVRIPDDRQFLHANRSRKAITTCLRQLGARTVLEIGCGKYPIYGDIELSDYRAIEIDQEAIDHGLSSGIDIALLSNYPENDVVLFDYAVALFVFHFPIREELVSYVGAHLSERGCFILNIIAGEGQDILNKLCLLSAQFTALRIIKPMGLATREYFIVAGRAASRAAEVAEKLQVCLAGE